MVNGPTSRPATRLSALVDSAVYPPTVMTLRVSDGGKSGSFDGFVLEVSGLAGASTRRLALEGIDSVALAEAGNEFMFVVKSRKGGFGLVVSAAKRTECDALVQAVSRARAAL